jgi:hypothetical protein
MSLSKQVLAGTVVACTLALGGASLAACQSSADDSVSQQGGSDLFGVDLGPEVTLPAGYESKSAADKREILQSMIEDSEYRTLPANDGKSKLELVTDLTRAAIGNAFLSKAFENDGDIMESKRQKILHRYGSTALVAFEPTSPVAATGLLSEHALGLIRIAPAVPPKDDDFTAGLALKLFVDGEPSVNLLAMYSVDGQGASHNTFQETFSTSIADAVGLPEKTLGKLFERVVGAGNAAHVGPDRLALVTSNGASVETGQATAVTKVMFEPTDEAKGLIPATSREDCRDALAKRVPAGTTLYRVFIARPDDANRTLVGTLKTETPFVASHVGDRLFFKHDVTPKKD